MKNSIIILIFLFAFTVTANAQEAKPSTKKEACCSSDKKTAQVEAKATCDKNSPTCCLLAEVDKAKCCVNDKAKAVTSAGKHSCNTDGSCCGDCKKSKTKV